MNKKMLSKSISFFSIYWRRSGWRLLVLTLAWLIEWMGWKGAWIYMMTSSNGNIFSATGHLCPEKFEWNFRYVIFKRILLIAAWGISCEIAMIKMSLKFTDGQSTLVQVMAWCRQATSHYLSQCWPRSLTSLGHNELNVLLQAIVQVAPLSFEMTSWWAQWCVNHRHIDCLLKSLFTRKSNKTSKLRVTGLGRTINWWPVDSPHKGLVTRKMFPFDDVIMQFCCIWHQAHYSSTAQFLRTIK